jgi:hypothetical protein
VTGTSYLARIGALAIAALLPALTYAQTGTLAEGAMRQMATRTVMPVVPPDALAALTRGVGVAVGQLVFDERGTTTDVTVLEAPSPSIAAALSKALKQWEFKRMRIGDPTPRLSSRVTFYFVARDGAVVVLNPQDAGYIGRWPDRPPVR